MPDFFETKFIWVGVRVEVVSKVVFSAFFEISLLIKLEPHVGHTKFPDFYHLS